MDTSVPRPMQPLGSVRPMYILCLPWSELFLDQLKFAHFSPIKKEELTAGSVENFLSRLYCSMVREQLSPNRKKNRISNTGGLRFFLGFP